MTRRMIVPLLFCVLGVILFTTLGFWQLQRLQWKQGILAEIDYKLTSAPVSVPATLDRDADRYMRVAVSGELDVRELHVLTSNGTAGYRIIAALALDDGRRILVERGFVPQSQKDAARTTGAITGTGYLMWPDETDKYTPAPERDENLWFARNVDLMASELSTEPVLVVLTDATNSTGIIPPPVQINIPNRHLEYVLTWFGFAIIWIGMTGLYLWRIKRRPM